MRRFWRKCPGFIALSMMWAVLVGVPVEVGANIAKVVPSNISATQVGPGHALVAWSAPVSGAVTGYKVDARFAGETVREAACDLGSRVDKTNCDLFDLEPGEWSFTVATLNGNVSDVSDPVTLLVDQVRPGSVRSLAVVVVTDGHLRATWQSPDPGPATGYRVDAQRSGAALQSWVCNFTARPDLTTCDLQNLEAGTWTITVYALHGTVPGTAQSVSGQLAVGALSTTTVPTTTVPTTTVPTTTVPTTTVPTTAVPTTAVPTTTAAGNTTTPTSPTTTTQPTTTSTQRLPLPTTTTIPTTTSPRSPVVTLFPEIPGLPVIPGIPIIPVIPVIPGVPVGSIPVPTVPATLAPTTTTTSTTPPVVPVQPPILRTRLADAGTIQEIVNSVDYKPLEHGEILRLYRSLFNREPDVPGAKYWINDIFEGQDRSLQEVASFIATDDQPEFARSYQDVKTADEFVERVYQNLLGRRAETGGKRYWVGQIRSGLSWSDTARFIALSPEFQKLFPYAPDRQNIELTQCDTANEVVVLANRSNGTINLAGYRLHDDGQLNTLPLSGTLGAGESLTILSGRNAVAGPGAVVGWGRDVWDDSGDVATLIDQKGVSLQLNCS